MMKSRFNSRITVYIALLGFSLPEFCFAKSLDLALAKKVAEAAESFGIKKKWLLSIAVVNEEGNLVYFQRGDRTYSGSIDAAIDKAKSANAFQRPTSAFVSSLKEGRLGLLSVRGIVALEGGVPLTLEGKHVGAIGVSGARSVEDEEAAIAGAQILGK